MFKWLPNLLVLNVSKNFSKINEIETGAFLPLKKLNKLCQDDVGFIEFHVEKLFSEENVLDN
jgi:hypothetical protein